MPTGNLFVDGVCYACGERQTPEGHDPCLGTLPGVKFACCGHGVRDGYIVFDNDVTIRFIPTKIERYSKQDYTQENCISLLEFDWSGQQNE
jgi:hypothetical protein